MTQLPDVCEEDCTCVSDLVAGWADIGRMADELLADDQLSPDERAGIEQVRRGAAFFIASLEEHP